VMMGVCNECNEGVEEKEAVGVEVSKMDARLAEQIVRNWQTAKARALGTSHSVVELPEVHFSSEQLL
jgi:hypothetical protein